MGKLSKLREVVTDDGIFYYQIEKASIYDYMSVYTKRIERTSLKILGKEYFIRNKTFYDIIPGDGWDNAWYLNHKGDRIENIKDVINKAVDSKKNFDPEWDGIMCSDKVLLRDLLITKILSENEQEKLLK